MAVKESVFHSSPEILGGTPVFRGTRVPIQNLFDFLAAGDSLGDFIAAFPSVTREQGQTALEEAEAAWVGDARTHR